MRSLPLAAGREVLLTLLERLAADPATEGFDEPATLEASEYNKSDFKYGPNVRGGDVAPRLSYGLTRYWRYAVGDEATSSALLERPEAAHDPRPTLPGARPA